ncbi:MAG TPA: ABC transporter substrate-binding protein [Candidatus Binatia bacterium]|nr:ABC transporter substrate-binding protein [Candidatus Binatia bacterium]
MLRLILGVLVLAALPAASFAQSPVTTIRVAVLGYTDASALPLYAQSAGFFKKYGLDAKITPFTGGGAVIAAIAGGSLDVGFSNIVSTAAAIQRGIPIVALVPAALFDEKDRADNLLVKARGSKLRTGADLNGKTVAVTTLSGALQLCASAWIDKNGGDSKTVHFVELPTSEMAAALRAGRVEAAMLAEPALTQGKGEVEELGDAFAAIAPRWILGVFVASKSWASANPDAAHRFIQAIVETARWANAHRGETAKILGPVSNIDPATFGAMARSTYGGSLNAALLQPPIDVAYKYAQLKAPLDAKQIVADAEPYWRGIR